MNRYLIFRTDRIGDFLISAILIKSIKRNDTSSHVTVIASKKNYDYIKSFKLVDEVILLKNNFFEKVKLIIKLRSIIYKKIIIHDNKKRSFLISFFLKVKKKISINNFLHLSHLEIIKKILSTFNYSISKSDLNILDEKKINKFDKKNYVLLHFDEKWVNKTYINEYSNIEPQKKELIEFFKSIISITKKKLIVTTGSHAPKILDDIFNNFQNKDIFFFRELDFLQLESVVVSSDLLISCHGSVSHLASAKEIKQIDIIDKSYNYGRWTEHFRNYNYIHRNNFSILASQITVKLCNF
jgi:ADP-heptose:LPS heptosyltransferase